MNYFAVKNLWLTRYIVAWKIDVFLESEGGSVGSRDYKVAAIFPFLAEPPFLGTRTYQAYNRAIDAI